MTSDFDSTKAAGLVGCCLPQLFEGNKKLRPGRGGQSRSFLF